MQATRERFKHAYSSRGIRNLPYGAARNRADLLAKGKDTPVLCTDGVVGMLVEFPIGDAPTDLAGIGVPGESDLRRIPQQELHRAGGALRQSGSPEYPLVLDVEGDSADTIFTRRLLRELWLSQVTQDHRKPGWFGRLSGGKSA